MINWQMLDNTVKLAIDSYIEYRVAQHREYVQLGVQGIRNLEQKMQLEEERRTRARKWHSEFTFYLNMYFVMFLLMVGSAVIGVAVGINLPEAIACRNPETPCWHLRLRDGRIVVAPNQSSGQTIPEKSE